MFASLHDHPRWLPFMGRPPEPLAAIRLDIKLPQ